MDEKERENMEQTLNNLLEKTTQLEDELKSISK